MPRRPLSNVDSAWWRMEDPTNLMMISGVLVMAEPMDFDRLKATLQDGLLRFERFRQRVVMPAGSFSRPYWEDDPTFDINYHLKRISLAPPADQTALQEVASELASTQLDLTKPLWQFHFVEHYGEGSALICRLHHCIGDGVALVHVLLSLTSLDPDSPPLITYMDVPSSAAPEQPPSRGLFRRSRRLIRQTRRLARTLVREEMDLLVHPGRAADLAKQGTEGAKALAVLVGRWPDPKTVFKGKLQVPKQAAWSAALPLGDVKTVGRRLGGTVNDVLLSAVAGALRRYLEGRDQPVDGLDFRAIVPVNLRKPGTEFELGNRFSLFFLSLPIGIADPVERLHELKRRMDGLKGSLEAPVAFGILNFIGLSPQQIQDIVVNIFGTKGTGVMTNVVGPRETIYLAGAPIEALMFWVPQSGRLGLGVSILSYANRVWLGVITDRGLVPDPEVIVAGFEAEFGTLLDIAQQIKPAPSVKAMSVQLDEALGVLDLMMEDELKEGKAAEAAAVSTVSPDGRCQALTREGQRCKNPALAGSTYCRVHQGQ